MALVLALAVSLLVNSSDLHIEDGRTIVDGVRINGHGPYRFLLDTGSNVTLMNAALAHSIGLQPAENIELGSAAGIARVPQVGEVEISLGAANATRQSVLLLDAKRQRELPSGVLGILGQNFLSRFDYLLDLQHKRVEFGARTSGGTRLPLEWINGRPSLSTNLGPMVLDSGSSQVILFRTGNNAFGDDRMAYQLRTVSGVHEVHSSYIESLRVGTRNIWRGEAIIMPERQKSEGNAAGLLPVRLFKKIYVCNSGNYVDFE